jgi:integrase/recombinase XerD
METIKKTIAEYFSYCVYEKNLSPKTLKAYNQDMDQFVDFLQKTSTVKEVQQVDKAIIRGFLKSLSHFKPKTIKRKVASLKAFLNFLEFDEQITVNPFRKIRLQLRFPKELPRVMNAAEVQKMIRSTYSSLAKEKRVLSYSYKERLRDVAVFEMLFATGGRVFEISSLKKESVNLVQGEVLFFGKGSKERKIQICNPETLIALKEYYNLFSKEIDKSGFFFVNRFGKRLSEQSIRFLVIEHADRVGMGRRITPHVFRHSFATLLLEENVDIKYIQHLLGHSSIMTTQIYTHVNVEKQRKILTNNHPRGNFNVYEEVK